MIQILFVDDQQHILEIGKKILERKSDFLVDTFSDGKSALLALESGKYNAVISDYGMPGMDGIQLLKKIRESGNNIPFIMFTGKGKEEVAIRALNAGADFYVQKEGELGPLFIELANQIMQSIRSRESELALKESEERFRTLIQNIPAVAVQGYYPDYKVVYWNQANERIYGYTPDEAIGKDLRDLIVPDEARELVSNEITKMAETGIPLAPSEMYLMHKCGEMVPVFSSHAVVQIPGKSPMLFCIDVDLSEQKATEESLLDANRKLNVLNSVTMESISDEMKTCIQILDNAKKSHNQTLLHGFMEDIREHIENVNRQIEDTKLYQGLGELSPLWHNLHQIIADLPHEYPKISANIQNVIIYADPSLPNVFVNLLDNCRRYGGRATEIHVSDMSIDNDYCIIWEDNGAGIPEKDKDRIFERGYEKQSGIGMHLSREILGITGISIHEKGNPENGARFEIIIPAHYVRNNGK